MNDQTQQMNLIDEPTLAEQAADILKAVAHPTRLRIAALLSEGDTHVGAMAERLGINQPIASQQLRILRMQGLVESTWVNGLAIYRLKETHLVQLISCITNCCRTRRGANSS